MEQQFSQELQDVVQATAEIYGKQMSKLGAIMYLKDLSHFTAEQVQAAMAKCRAELKFFPSVADVISRVEDGRPGIEAAWSMIPKDENGSIVWTDEMAEAFGVARGLIDSDPIAARMAFKEKYSELISIARSKNKPANWTPSLGHSKDGRFAAMKEAVAKGRISSHQATKYLPEYAEDPTQRVAQGGGLVKLEDVVKQIEQKAREAGHNI